MAGYCDIYNEYLCNNCYTAGAQCLNLCTDEVHHKSCFDHVVDMQSNWKRTEPEFKMPTWNCQSCASDIDFYV